MKIPRTLNNNLQENKTNYRRHSMWKTCLTSTIDKRQGIAH